MTKKDKKVFDLLQLLGILSSTSSDRSLHKKGTDMSKTTKFIKDSSLADKFLKDESRVTICQFNAKFNDKIHLVTKTGFISEGEVIGFCAEKKVVTKFSFDEAKKLMSELKEAIEQIESECENCHEKVERSSLNDSTECIICAESA